MKNLSFFCALFFFVAVEAQEENALPQYCTRELQGALEGRVKHADVVITGTVIRVETEHRAPWDFLDDDWTEVLSEVEDPRPGSQRVGFVKLWRVVKGSLAQVENETSGPQDLLSFEDASENGVLSTPVLKLYGIWNDKLCGSHVTTGDTRIFFLKKFPDFRNIVDTNVRSGEADPERLESLKAAPTSAEMAPTLPRKVKILPELRVESGGEELTLMNVENAVSETNSTMSEPVAESLTTSKKRKRGKKKKKGKNKKKKGQKKKKKGSVTTKSGKKPRRKERKKGAKRKRKSTESLSSEWKRLFNRPKRSVGAINKASEMVSRGVRIRRGEADMEPKSVLVLYSPPARITLANLNGVESMVNSP